MIINVTGGPDLSLVEVSEASAIIQEAAHEDANIIFGAVVDPKMEGKVKITVIATGFDRAGVARRPSRVGGAQTPVDLQLVHRVEAGAGERSPARRRRAAVAVAALGARDAHRRRAGRRRRTTAAPGAEFEPVSPLDVPAFLRRQARRRPPARSSGVELHAVGSPSSCRRPAWPLAGAQPSSGSRGRAW